MKLEAALAITLAFPGGVVVKPRPSKEDQEVIDWARQFVRANALDAIEATRDAWRLNKPGQEGLIDDAIAAHYGERCPDFDPGCSTCKAWKQYDDLTAAAAKLDEALPCEVTVAPATRFGKGVKLATVLSALDLRRAEKIGVAAALAIAMDEGRLPPVPPPSNLNENNISTPAPEPFDFDNEGISLAEQASQWSGDWCDFAEAAEKRLRAAYVAGLREAVEIFDAPDSTGGHFHIASRMEAIEAVRARIAEMEAKA